jgi:hypothetical protein
MFPVENFFPTPGPLTLVQVYNHVNFLTMVLNVISMHCVNGQALRATCISGRPVRLGKGLRSVAPVATLILLLVRQFGQAGAPRAVGFVASC